MTTILCPHPRKFLFISQLYFPQKPSAGRLKSSSFSLTPNAFFYNHAQHTQFLHPEFLINHRAARSWISMSGRLYCSTAKRQHERGGRAGVLFMLWKGISKYINNRNRIPEWNGYHCLPVVVSWNWHMTGRISYFPSLLLFYEMVQRSLLAHRSTREYPNCGSLSAWFLYRPYRAYSLQSLLLANFIVYYLSVIYIVYYVSSFFKSFPDQNSIENNHIPTFCYSYRLSPYWEWSAYNLVSFENIDLMELMILPYISHSSILSFSFSYKTLYPILFWIFLEFLLQRRSPYLQPPPLQVGRFPSISHDIMEIGRASCRERV